ncbi:folylpolyglutamate synthase-like [Chenopodium quinoa]|uniref:folylpolyglutamate synthase-like n=1 Tax=Chenopodium quinoa TaxID=63459 RepID=UPI000B782C62|nr:folylpolyglutamate synthase-like [Chenopodium quinoa]XP_021754655.1 folylpolyglutamate synthase-like [Chenopodium quinoa]XP_021754656.1 folylpolyglutamate synthase-like [Chenopodium quinoa]
MSALSSLITTRTRAEKSNSGDHFELLFDYIKILEVEEPISKLKVIHVAGTKGKFTCAIDDLKAGLRRRGPDSLGTKKFILEVKDAEVHSYVARDEETERENSCLHAMYA